MQSNKTHEGVPVSISALTRRNLRLCVECIVNGVNRRDAENAETTQRRIFKTATQPSALPSELISGDEPGYCLFTYSYRFAPYWTESRL